MGSKKVQVNTFSGGMSMDVDKSLLKPGQYRYAENVRTITNEGSTTGALTNIESSDIVKLGSNVFATGEDIIGTATVRDLGVVFTEISGDSPVKRNGHFTISLTPEIGIAKANPYINSTIPITVTGTISLFKIIGDGSAVTGMNLNVSSLPSDRSSYTIQHFTITNSSITSYNGYYDGPPNSTLDYNGNLELYRPFLGDSSTTANISITYYGTSFQTVNITSISNYSIVTGSTLFVIDSPLSNWSEGGGTAKTVQIVTSYGNYTGTQYCRYIDSLSFYIEELPFVPMIRTGVITVFNQYESTKTKFTSTSHGLATGNVLDSLTSTDGDYSLSNITISVIDSNNFTYSSWVSERISHGVSTNHIYRVSTTNELIPVFTNILPQGIDFGIPANSALSIVGRYEDSDNIKVYWADGVNYIRVINIALNNDANNFAIDSATMFDIVPSAVLKRPSVSSIGSGKLNSGLIQYCYQLYSPSGAETELSPMSPIVSLTSSDIVDKSIKYIGTGLGAIYGKPSGKSVRIKIDIPSDNQFTRLKLISVYYYNSSEVPVITIVKETDIDSELSIIDGVSSVYLEDGGVGAIGELTQAEFNLIGGNLFKPNYIESKNNILFAANTKEDTWNIPLSTYDTRAYQFANYTELVTPPGVATFTTIVATGMNSIGINTSSITGTLSTMISIGSRLLTVNGTVVARDTRVTSINDSTHDITFDNSDYYSLYISACVITISTTPAVYSYEYKTKIFDSSGIGTDYAFSDLHTIAYTHDCIHKEIYEESRYADLLYKYNKDGYLGGSGTNVSYLFANTYFIESHGDFWSKQITEGTWNTTADKYIDQRTARIGDKKRTISSLLVKDSAGIYTQPAITDLNVPAHDGFLNYANPYLSNNLVSYQRDEIYRFAAVFKDEKGRKSPASWIADIRFPAGYNEETSWTSNIFETPSEITEGYNGTFLADQELLIKPLGIKFTFKNLPSRVKSVEIVRAKRDINNKTIYAQGTVQKVGTYKTEYQQNHAGNPANIIAGPITESLIPHSIMSMGYSYSIAGPVRQPNHNTGFGTWESIPYSWSEFDDNSHNANNSQNRTRPNYTDHSLAPYFYYKNSILFINPETSYYGIDFVEQLRNISGDMELDIVDVIYPVSTPLLIGMDASTNGTSYYGHNELRGFQFKDGPNDSVLPFAMYFGADINTKNYSKDITPSDTGILSTMGMVGMNWKRISGNSSDFPQARNGGTGAPICDIVNPSADTNDNEIADRAFISLGGIIRSTNTDGTTYCYKNGYTQSLGDSLEDPALIRIDAAEDESRLGFTFKYFNRYSPISDTGNYIGLIYQRNNNISGFTNLSIRSLSIQSPTTGADVFSTGTQVNLTKKIDSFEYSGNITPGPSVDKITGSNYISSGQKQYLNWTVPLTSGNEGETGSTGNLTIINPLSKTKVSGAHGDGIIFNFTDENQLPSIQNLIQKRKKYTSELYTGYEIIDTTGSSALGTFVVNMKVMNSYIYGGSGLLDRQFTEYISTGTTFNNTGADTTVLTFGGDTFIGLFDYSIVRATDPYVLYNSLAGENGRGANIANQTRYVGALIPLESSVNLHLVNSKSYVADNYNFAIQKDPGVYSPGANEGSTWKYTQELPQFAYNAAYSAENTAIGFLSKLLITKDNKTFDCRIWSSLPKTNDEIYDSWSKWKVADYIDVDTQYGEITGLRKFKDKLLFWQKNAFGVATTNERSLIKDNNISSLVLGTAGILSRFDYITTANGFKKGTTGGIIDSESGLYWYDLDNSEMCVFDNQTSALSKAKGIQTLLNKNRSNIQSRIPMVYDKKYNEVLLTLYGLTGADTIV